MGLVATRSGPDQAPPRADPEILAPPLDADPPVMSVSKDLPLVRRCYRLLGSVFEIGFADGWTFTPKAGRARWKLHSEEGAFFGSGLEIEADIRGYEYFWEAQISRELNDKVALGAAYQEGEFDFGRARSLSFVATFRF